ncbi:MAG: 50S ribosomal protein L9 [Deltaproteobacteria bacterium]|jgi:large subunit ribosomal protein L9|nr:50S ribosomal protein L9 [Deltaproteobacteria bacterium]
MEIILTRDVDNLGLAGQVLKVSAGYARNYLLPGSFALPATPDNLKVLSKKREEFEKRALAAKEEASLLKEKIDGLVLTITRKSVDKGKLYGAVTPQDLVDAALEQGYALDRRRLKISEPIKAVGDYEIGARLHPEVTATFKLKVLAEPKPEPEPEPEVPEGKRGKGRRTRQDARPRDEAKTEDSAETAEAADGAGDQAEAAPQAEASGSKAGSRKGGAKGKDGSAKSPDASQESAAAKDAPSESFAAAPDEPPATES